MSDQNKIARRGWLAGIVAAIAGRAWWRKPKLVPLDAGALRIIDSFIDVSKLKPSVKFDPVWKYRLPPDLDRRRYVSSPDSYEQGNGDV